MDAPLTYTNYQCLTQEPVNSVDLTPESFSGARRDSGNGPEPGVCVV